MTEANSTDWYLAKTVIGHTPGPWVVGEGLRGYDFGIVKKIEMAEIGIADIPEGVHVGEAEANARLIAAAPDMLAALKDALRLMDTMANTQAAKVLTSAIAKAEGR